MNFTLPCLPQLSLPPAAQHKLRGNQMMAARQFAAAVAAYTSAIDLEPNAVFYANRAAAHFKLGNYDSVAADSKRAIELDPDYVKAYVRWAKALQKQSEFPKAHALFDIARSRLHAKNSKRDDNENRLLKDVEEQMKVCKREMSDSEDEEEEESDSDDSETQSSSVSVSSSEEESSDTSSQPPLQPPNPPLPPSTRSTGKSMVMKQENYSVPRKRSRHNTGLSCPYCDFVAPDRWLDS